MEEQAQGNVLFLCERGAGINQSTGLISYGSNVKMLLVTEPIDAEKVIGHLSHRDPITF